MLIQSGWPRETLLVTVVSDKQDEGHAVLTVTTNKSDYVLDNQNEDILLWSETGYRFVKRQSPSDPNVWVSLGRPHAEHSVADLPVGTFFCGRKQEAARTGWCENEQAPDDRGVLLLSSGESCPKIVRATRQEARASSPPTTASLSKDWRLQTAGDLQWASRSIPASLPTPPKRPSMQPMRKSGSHACFRTRPRARCEPARWRVHSESCRTVAAEAARLSRFRDAAPERETCAEGGVAICGKIACRRTTPLISRQSRGH